MTKFSDTNQALSGKLQVWEVSLLEWISIIQRFHLLTCWHHLTGPVKLKLLIAYNSNALSFSRRTTRTQLSQKNNFKVWPFPEKEMSLIVYLPQCQLPGEQWMWHTSWPDDFAHSSVLTHQPKSVGNLTDGVWLQYWNKNLTPFFHNSQFDVSFFADRPIYVTSTADKWTKLADGPSHLIKDF